MKSKVQSSKLKIGKYIPSEIEKKWQEKWEEEGLYNVDIAKIAAGKKYYTLVELPYPSGDLHIGHWFTFAAPDILSRYKRMRGFSVFFPMGYDAFGLPAENAAIKRNVHPKDWTMNNIATMTKQFQSMGTMIDWKRLTITCLPEYYAWNQWIFIKMYEKGLAYRSKTLSNWCPFDQTVLANEHVENGRCWRCGNEVVQKEVEQWFLKITAYADRLLWKNQKEDWPNSVKSGQNDWIGKKDGIKINHTVADTNISFQSFSAYPAWSWADSFIVIAPEHPLVKDLVKGTKYEKPVLDFVNNMAKQTELERKENTEKLGVFTGRYAKDPFGGPDMPIWLANFALMNFGTGIIRCSGHDPRDVEFAAKYGIKTKEVVDRIDPNMPINAHDEKGVLKDSGPFTGREVGEVREEVMEWIVKEGIGERFINYHLHDWSVSRQRYWGTPVPMIHCGKCGIVPVPLNQLPVELPYDVDYMPKGKPPLASNEEWLQVSCPKCGGKAKRDAETLDTFFDSSWYYYRYVDPDYEKGPFDTMLVKKLLPVDIYFGGSEHTLGHTLYARFFTKFFKDIGLLDFDEFAKKRVQHGIVLGPDGNKMSKSKGNVINPDDVVKEFGADAVRLYLSFMMPYDATAPWATGALWGTYRFLKRIWELTDKLSEEKPSVEDLVQLHKTIRKVGLDIEAIKMNTAVAALMEWLNYLSAKKYVSKEEYRALLLLLAPFAPHMTEELWQKYNGSEKKFSSIHVGSWPKFDEKYLAENTVTVVVQVNGKVRENITVKSSDISDKNKIEQLAKGSEKVQKYLGDKKILKVVYVPGKIINFVVEN